MPRNLDDLIRALESEKLIVSLSGWKPAARKNEAAGAIEIEGIIEEGLSFRARCNPDLPDENISLMLFTETAHKQRCFARVDWRTPPHDNTNRRFCADYWGEEAGRSHFHDPRLHTHMSVEDLFQTPSVDLPIAVKIDPEPTTFRDLLETSATILRILNLSELPEPPWPREPLLI